MKVITYRCDVCDAELVGPRSTIVFTFWEGRRITVGYDLCPTHNNAIHAKLTHLLIDSPLL